MGRNPEQASLPARSGLLPPLPSGSSPLLFRLYCARLLKPHAPWILLQCTCGAA
jgi:hypothetical protein